MISYIVTAIVQTFIYVYAAKTLGETSYGLWAFLYSGALVISLSNVGLPNFIIAFSSKYLASKNYKKLALYLYHSLLLFILTFPIIVLLTGLIFFWGLSSLNNIKIESTTVFLLIVLFFLQNIVALLFSFLDGVQQTVKKTYALISSNLFFLLAALFLLKKNSINSLIICQILFYSFQTIWVTILNISFFKNRLIIKDILQTSLFRKDIFKEIYKTSSQYFLISLSVIFYEPLVRYIIGKYINISAITEFDITNRLINGVRNLYVNAIQVIYPYFGYKVESEKTTNVYEVTKKVTNLIFVASSFCFMILPTIIYTLKTKIYTHFNETTIYLIFFTVFASFVNIISTPSYFLSLAIKKTVLNLLHHISYFIFLVLLLLILFLLNKETQFVLFIPATSFLLGSLIMIFLFQKKLKKGKILFQKNISTILIMVLFYILQVTYLTTNSFSALLLLILTCIIYLFVYFIDLKFVFQTNKETLQKLLKRNK